MRLFPIIFSMNYSGYEMVTEVNEALEAVGYYVYSASTASRFNSCIKSEDELLDEIKHYLEAAVYMTVNSPTVEVAVVVHYDNPSIFLRKELQKMVGTEPFINYVDACKNEVSVCAFRDGEMEFLYQVDDMPPYMMMGYHSCIVGDANRRMHIIPVKYKHCYINDAVLSVRERWFEVLSKDALSASYLRTYLKNDGVNVNQMLYEALCTKGVWHCLLVKDDDVARRFTEDVARALVYPGGVMRTYECYEIIGTNIFLLISDSSEYSDLIINFCSTEEQMNKFLDSQLFEEIAVKRL